MEDKLIFISCGQQTEGEKQIGASVKALIDGTAGFKAYFAEYVQSLEPLAVNIFEKLWQCSGAIAFLHRRGLVSEEKDKALYYSSVWVNQELAILAYRCRFEKISIPILAFKDADVRLEGAMTSLIVNPSPIGAVADILEKTKDWLSSSVSDLSCSNETNFSSKWEKLTPESQKVIAALLDEGGECVEEAVVKTRLKEGYGMSKADASKAVQGACLHFKNTGLVLTNRNSSFAYEMTINPIWRRQIARKARSG